MGRGTAGDRLAEEETVLHLLRRHALVDDPVGIMQCRPGERTCDHGGGDFRKVVEPRSVSNCMGLVGKSGRRQQNWSGKSERKGNLQLEALDSKGKDKVGQGTAGGRHSC